MMNTRVKSSIVDGQVHVTADDTVLIDFYRYSNSTETMCLLKAREINPIHKCDTKCRHYESCFSCLYFDIIEATDQPLGVKCVTCFKGCDVSAEKLHSFMRSLIK